MLNACMTSTKKMGESRSMPQAERPNRAISIATMMATVSANNRWVSFWVCRATMNRAIPAA